MKWDVREPSFVGHPDLRFIGSLKNCRSGCERSELPDTSDAHQQQSNHFRSHAINQTPLHPSIQKGRKPPRQWYDLAAEILGPHHPRPKRSQCSSGLYPFQPRKTWIRGQAGGLPLVIIWWLSGKGDLSTGLGMQRGLASFDNCGLGMKREGMSGSPPSSGTLTYVLSGFGF
jgi:hypothetical protein